MKSFRYYLLILVVVLSVSCRKDVKEGTDIKSDNDKIELTPEEVASIKFDEPKELTTAEIKEIISSHPLFEAPATKGTSTNSSFSIEEKYYIKNDGKANGGVTPKTKGAAKDSLPVYKVSITSGKETSSVFVGGDSRTSAVLAFLSGTKVQASQLEEDPMYQYSKSILLSDIRYMSHLRDSLKVPTLRKIESKLGQVPAVNIYETLKGKISIKEALITKSSPISNITEPIVAKIGPLTKTQWEQEGIFNLKLDKVNCAGTDILPPAGCLPIATVQLLGFYKPAMTVPGANGSTITIDWNALQETPDLSPWGWPAPTQETIDMAGYLLRHVFIGLKTTPRCTEGAAAESAAYTSDAEAYLRNYINIDGATGFNVNTVKSSLDQLRLVLATGNRTTTTGGKSGHAWVVDGYAVTRKPGTTNVFNTYLHCNIGWFWGTGSGWFLVENPLAFTPVPDYNYTNNLMCSPQARKK